MYLTQLSQILTAILSLKVPGEKISIKRMKVAGGYYNVQIERVN